MPSILQLVQRRPSPAEDTPRIDVRDVYDLDGIDLDGYTGIAVAAACDQRFLAARSDRLSAIACAPSVVLKTSCTSPFCMASSTRWRVSSRTFGWSLSTRDTVWWDTPASRATSIITADRRVRGAASDLTAAWAGFTSRSDFAAGSGVTVATSRRNPESAQTSGKPPSG